MIFDGDWALLDHDAATGRTVWVRDNGDGTMTARTDYPHDALLSENAAFRNALDPGWKGDWHRVASIPLNIFHDQLGEAARQNDDKYISKWLNDADHFGFRTKEGKV